MPRTLFARLGMIGLLILLLLVPIQLIDGIISDRQIQRNAAVEDIARSSSYRQSITGPLLVVPYHRKTRTYRLQNNVRFQEEVEIQDYLYFLPESYVVNGRLETEVRKRGIYQARLYHAHNSLSGSFGIPVNWGIAANLEKYNFGEPFIAIGVSDVRGIENNPVLALENKKLPFQPGTGVEFLGDGIHVPLSIKRPSAALTLEFAVDLDLQGTGQLDILPVGRETRVSLDSDWPHPRFVGSYLPVRREIGDAGFSALWRTSYFSTNLRDALANCTVRSKCEDFKSRRLGVSLIDPVDQYLKTDRAIKYALLFIGLTFAAFFLLEVLKGFAVHPLQYGLVGLSLAVFYLLLLSLAEHIGFARAYLISAICCVLLNGFYVGNVLHSRVRGLGFACGLTALYTMLYGLLSAEDYGLVMGSILVFSLLGLFMLLTRNIDWFSVGEHRS